MLKLRWSARALEEADNLASYIGERNQSAGENLIERLEFCAKRLAEFPYMHRAGRVSGTREAVISPNYVLVYRVTADAVEVINVLHARQQYP